MKKLKLVLLTVAILFAAISQLHSQTLDEIIAKNVEATGGKDKIKSITSLYLENTIEVMGNESTRTIVILNGKGAKTKSDFNGQAMIECYTDKGGWMINPMMGGADATSMPAEQYNSGKQQIYIEEAFVDYAAKKNKVELLGKDKIKNTEVFKIKVTTPENNITTFFIDASTYYIVQVSTSADMMGQTTEVITKFSDYQKTDFGYVLPKVTEISYGDQFSIVLKLKKAEFNKEIDPTIFDLGNLK